MTMNKTYSELSALKTFEDRFLYLEIKGSVGKETFGYRRWINQEFYHSDDWLRFRDQIIIRDEGCDLGVKGFDIIEEPILIHHLNPITWEDIIHRRPCVLDPENVICTRLKTHNAIHYGDESILLDFIVSERSINDTCPWKKI